MSKITWMNETRKLSQLQPWPRNPRQIKSDQAKRLAESFDTFGQVETIAIGPDGEIYNGHQRLNVLMQQHGPDYEVEVRVSSRALTEKEREKLTVFLHKGAAGEWNFDILANEFEFDELIEWGFKPFELGMTENVNYDEIWQGMPEFEQESKNAVKSIGVHFMTMDDYNAFSDLVGQKLTEKTKTIWYPKKDPMNLKPYRVQDES